MKVLCKHKIHYCIIRTFVEVFYLECMPGIILGCVCTSALIGNNNNIKLTVMHACTGRYQGQAPILCNEAKS